jgi:L-arabinonolactonase
MIEKMQPPNFKERAEIAVDAANQLGEGVVWSPAQGRVLWTDIIGKAFWSYDPVARTAQKLDLPERLACFAASGGASILAGFASGLARFDLRSGLREPLAAIEPDLPTTRLNDGKLDRRGRFVFGTMDEAPSGRQPLGHVWSYNGQSPPRILFGDVQISNSIAFSPDGRQMYFADTPLKKIFVFDYDPDEGRISNRAIFAEIGAEGGFPDGSTVDAQGYLWNAEWEGARLVRYSPDGRVDRTIPMPCSRLTCCAFGGDDLATLFVTSARTGLDDTRLAAQPLAGALFALDVGVCGLADTMFQGFESVRS